MAEKQPHNLPQLFTQGWIKFKNICNSSEPSNSPALQAEMKQCYQTFVQCTEMVNQLALFSSNEFIEDISTENIKYLLLPVFLGEILLKTTTSTDRHDSVANAKTYIFDFLKRCYDYQLTSIDVSTAEKNDKSVSLQEKNKSREAKINRFKHSKEINERIDIIEKRQKISAESVDDCDVRSLYLDYLQLWVNNSTDNIELIDSELEILEHMKNLKLGKVKPPPAVTQNLEPTKPVLITRDMLKKRVFGAGYRNLPTMTEEEYFQKELREGKIVQEYNDGKTKNPIVDSEEESEEEETDEKLQKARQWDEWKDTHRRGDGNKDKHG